jgi:predicted nucleic acid-binding protein
VKIVLDACVLYPARLREILLGVAGAGLFTPLFSQRILEEWARATRKIGPVAEVEARLAVAQVMQDFPRAMVPAVPAVEARLVLPDDNDVHVLAVAIAAGADAICTFNAQDFPRHVLMAEGIARRDPDGLLWEFWSHQPDVVAGVVEEARQTAERFSGTEKPLRAFLKKAGLPRLGKAMSPPRPMPG